jgi:hypothetical protein
MTFWKRCFGFSTGGTLSSTDQLQDDLSVKFRIVPIPHGRWALEKSAFTYIYPIGLRREWRVVGEYESVEAAQADYRHVFCTPVIPVEASDPE